MIEITQNEIDVERLVDYVRQDGDGAVVTFMGVVRDNSGGERVSHLFYEAYEEMALAKLKELAEEAKKRWDVDRIAISHRVGRLEIGEKSVVIAVSAPHRGEAFEACHFVIDRLKEIVPIWKKEVTEDGETWIHPHP